MFTDYTTCSVLYAAREVCIVCMVVTVNQSQESSEEGHKNGVRAAMRTNVVTTADRVLRAR